MSSLTRAWTWCVGVLALAVLGGLASPLFAQAVAGQPGAGSVRQLAPGVMKAIDPEPDLGESVSRHDVVELLAVDPGFDWAKDIPFRRDIWFLEFRFKPVRMIWADVPQASGKMRRTLVWYLVYSVTNRGKAMHPSEANDGTFEVVAVDKPVRFIPQFLLESHEFGKVYPDRVLPVAMGPISLREDRGRKFHNSVEMTRQIAVGETVWGVATWENLDPLIDRFSIYVGGLTNAYRWRDEPGSFQPGDPIGKGRRLARKTLKLNYWRPGDEFYQDEKEIRYGIPGEVDSEWVYR